MSSKKDEKKKDTKKDTKDKKKDDKKDDKKKTDSKKSDSKTKDTKKKDDTKKKEKEPKKESKDKKPASGTKESAKKGPVQALKKEYKKWLDSAEETANLDWKSVNDEDKQVIMAFGKHEFYVTFPESYPDCDVNFFVFSTGDGMDDWNDAMQEACDKQLTFTEVLTKCAENFLEHGPEVSDHSEEAPPQKGSEKLGDMDYDFGDDIDKAQSPQGSSSKKVDDSEFANKKFLEIGSPAATLRLIQDLKTLKKGDSESLGFVAKPKLEPGKNLENLYHWEVKLSGFTGEIGDDLKKLASGFVELEMRFSKDYPFQPPFVRVVQPRFKFLTGHVTVGGSICMELLTNSGWRSTNDIESILIQIRAEMQEGGARLEGGGGSYSESEAWSAFYRAAKNHGWDVKGLDQNMFPKV